MNNSEQNSSSQNQSTADLCRVGPISSFQAEGNLDFIVDQEKQNFAKFPASLLKNLLKCTLFKPLKEHARSIWAEASFLGKIQSLKYIFEEHYKKHGEITLSPRGCREMLGNLLEEFIQKEFMVSQKTFSEWAAVKGAPSVSTVPRIASLGIITRNRVEELRISLTSYIENAQKWERSIEFFVIDDSPEESMRNNYRSQLKQIKEKYHVPILYAGLEEKKDFAQKLEQEGIPKPVIEFALFDQSNYGETYGINRNAFLLQTVGELTLSADDDTIGHIAKSPNYREGLKIQHDKKPYECWQFSSRKEAMDLVSFTEDDLCKLHEQALGKTMGQCIHEVSSFDQLDLEHMDVSFMRFLKRGEGHVFISLIGIVGDSGSNSPEPVLFSSDKEGERLFQSQAHYQMALKSRESCKTSEQLLITGAGGLMTTFLGMDNRDILPPFFPVFRMEDSIFGKMIQRVQKDSFFAYLPWVLKHCPLEQREHHEKQLHWDRSFGVNEVIDEALKRYYPGFGPKIMSQNMKSMAEHLMDLGSTAFEEYRELIRFCKIEKHSTKIQQYESTLKEHQDFPRYWKDDIKELIKSISKNALAPIHLAPSFFIEELGQEPAEKMIQKMIYQFGELVHWWPEIIEATKELRKQGVRLASPICS